MAKIKWHAFNFGDYITDTMRLSCEGHGAYIQLIADYYNTGEPPPDDDEILAAITKLPLDRWQQHRKVLIRFFSVTDGFWHHERIEREMREASEAHAKRIAAASAANEARWPKKGDKAAPSRVPKARDTARTPKTPIAIRDVSATESVTVSVRDPHLHIHSLSQEREREEGSLSEVDEVDLEELGTGVPKDFVPDPETSDRARAAGLAVEEIDGEVRKFINHNRSAGNVSSDWQASFATWIDRGIEYRGKQKAPPRVEVDVPYVPSEADIVRALAGFKRGIAWSHKAFGPEPGMRGCKIDPRLIEAAGIDLRRAS